MQPTTAASPSPTKKRRTGEASSKSSAKTNRTKAKAEGFGTSHFPIDMLYEIAVHIDPRDLVSVSRTSKPLHLALTSKSSRFLWKAAVRNAQLPPCPEDLNEMQYVRFACDNSCDYCGKRPGRWGDLHRIYGNRRKACKNCLQTFACTAPELYHVPGIFIPGKLRHRGDVRLRGDFYIPPEEKNAVDARLAEVRPDKTATRALIEEMEQEMHKKNQLKFELRGWLKNEEKEEEERRKLVRHPRYHEVVNKLKATGWAEDLEWMHSQESRYKERGLHTVKTVNMPSKLTPAAWEKMKPDVLEFMVEVRGSRLEEMRSDRVPLFLEAYNNYVQKRPYDPYGPSSADIANQPEVSELIFAPLSESVSEEDFAQLLEESFDTMKDNWRASAEEDLVKFMKRRLPGASTEHLRSPATAFSCQDCELELLFPHVLTHTKCIPRKNSKFGDDLPVAPWHHSRFKFEYGLYKEAQAVLETLDEPPSSNMLSFELFECSNCSIAMNRRVLMTWNEAISMRGCFCVRRDHTIRKATLTPEEEMLKNLYVDLSISMSPDECIICAICHVPLASITDQSNASHLELEFEEHQSYCHKLEKETWREGVDFYRQADAVAFTHFHRDFILNEGTDTRDIFRKRLNQTLKVLGDASTTKVPDLRTYM